MSTSADRTTGGCLCGSVTYTIGEEADPILHCHCENCRRLTGNFVAAMRATTNSITVEDKRNTLTWYDLGYARYAFCQECGATLFYQATDRQQYYSVMVGTLDEPPRQSLAGIWYANEAQPHNQLPADIPQYNGNP